MSWCKRNMAGRKGWSFKWEVASEGDYCIAYNRHIEHNTVIHAVWCMQWNQQ